MSGEKKAKNSEIKELLDEAFDEDVSDIEQLNTADNSIPNKDHSRDLHFAVGLFVVIMSVIGVISTAITGYKAVVSILNNTAQKEDFARFIYPVVICDPPTFEQSQRFRNDTIISAAVWDIIMYSDKEHYTHEFDYIIVPEIDIEQHAAKIFGGNLDLTHHTIANSGFSFYYDDSLNSYRIPEQPDYFTYSPYIDSISRNGEIYTLRVGYISPAPDWLTSTSDKLPEPEKYVQYVVSRHGNSYTLISVNSIQDNVQTEST